jgi:natural product biosynthesis luciferase-like monooxygenase protein
MKFGILSLLDHYIEDKSEQQYYEDFLEEATYAEELGFESVWIGEHHFGRYICPSPQVVAGALARATKKMRIGTAVVLLPHHDPVRLAEDYAMVDLLSGGRLDFGVGRGFIKAIYDGFNQSMDESRERFDEALEIIERAWSQPTFSYEGKFRRVSDVTILPRPLQKPTPPIWMAAAVSPESFVVAGQKGHPLLLALFALPLNALKERVQLYRETLAAAGHSPDKVEIAAGYHGFVDETPEQARRKWEPHYMRYLRFVASLLPPPDEISGSQYQAWKQLGSHLQNVTFEQMYPKQVLCGDAAQCIERIALLQEELGIDHFHMYMDLGGMEHREVMRSLERFATRVMPHFRSRR